MSVSASFEQSIHLFDPLLSVRRGIQFEDKWVIERKAFIPDTEIFYLKRRVERTLRFMNNTMDPAKKAKLRHLWRELAEEFEAARKGRRVVIFADNLDRTVFDRLVAGDIQRYGGYSRFAVEMEEKELQKEQQLERDLARIRDEKSYEAFDKMNFAWKHKDAKLIHWDGKESLTSLIR